MRKKPNAERGHLVFASGLAFSEANPNVRLRAYHSQAARQKVAPAVAGAVFVIRRELVARAFVHTTFQLAKSVELWSE